MKATYNWIKEFVDINLSPEQLADKLTMAGIEVKAIESRGGDFVFEIEITSNRPDWLSVLGIAREVAAVTGKRLKKRPAPVKALLPRAKGGSAWKIEIEDPLDCPLYTAKILTGVTVGASPQWLRQRLELVGCRSVNNVVDITNYCLYELGEPLHAFDLDTLTPGVVAVRRARAGEKILTIDGQEQKLNTSVLVIADASVPIAVAGVMGGKATEVTEKTRNVLLEAAIFRPVIVRRGRQSLALQSEASYRFERGIDSGIVEIASMRAVELMRQLCNANLAAEVSSGARKPKSQGIVLNIDRVTDVLGVPLPVSRVQTILSSLEFPLKKKGSQAVVVTVPTHRPDVCAEIDLIEEIARIYGFERVPASLAAVKLQVSKDATFKNISGLKTLLVSFGLDEVITYSMTDRQSIAGFWDDQGALVEISNPLSQEQELLRPTLMPAVAGAVAYNLRQQQEAVSIFEIAKTYQHRSGRLHEDYHVCIALSGSRSIWLEQEKTRKSDAPGFLHLKGIVSGLFDRCGAGQYDFVPVGSDRVDITVAGSAVGVMRKLSLDILDRLGIKNRDVYMVEIPLSIFLKTAGGARRYEPISRYPGIARDISIVVKDEIATAQVLAQIRERGGEFLQRVLISNFYKGSPIPQGHKNLTISCFYRSGERTLQEDEVNARHAAVIDLLKDKFGAVIR
jgi:phenylalanyl-tRNA synthetase beta chain